MEGIIHGEVYIFFATLYGGMIIGFIYDLYRIFRYVFKPKRVATFIEDLIFWIFVTSIALFIIIFSNWGELRGYIFIGFLIGAFLYNKFLSKFVITILVKFIRLIGRVIKYILLTLSYPFRFIWRKVSKPYRRFKDGASRRYRKIKRKSKLPFRFIKDMKKYTKTILFKKK